MVCVWNGLSSVGATADTDFHEILALRQGRAMGPYAGLSPIVRWAQYRYSLNWPEDVWLEETSARGH